MTRTTCLAVLLLAGLALAGARAAAGDEKAAEPAEAKAEFKPPPGWKKKKRGQYVVYCRKDAQGGTRMPKETCYDEQGIRDMLAAQRDDTQKVDQMRRICGMQGACGSN